MDVLPTAPREPDTATRTFYVDAMKALDRAQIPYVVGGGYAMAYYTGIARNTKDLDLFIRPQDRDRTLTTLTAAGYRTEFFYPFWIAKALCGDSFIDLLYNSGNGACPVDDEWLTHAVDSDVIGYRTRLVPAEEQLWSKAFVQDRDRYDGADVAHLILCQGSKFDWDRLLRRFRGHEPVLLAHAILFRYSYPSERDCVPQWVMERLKVATHESMMERVNGTKLCRGTFLAQKSYGQDVSHWGFADGRLEPHGPLSREELEQLPKD
jgi:Aminoglycoside-2''-adenylyltransferase